MYSKNHIGADSQCGIRFSQHNKIHSAQVVNHLSFVGPTPSTCSDVVGPLLSGHNPLAPQPPRTQQVDSLYNFKTNPYFKKGQNKSIFAYQATTKEKAMGNCLVLQENVVRIMKTDGKILEYKTPIKVEQVLIDFSGHAVSDSQPVQRHLQPNTKLLCGQLYYLVPLPPPSPKARKKVRFAEPEVQDVQKSSVVRIKLVISKQELQDMLHSGGISVNKMLSLVQGEKGIDSDSDSEDLSQRSDDDVSQGWKPELESIPEVN
ncbi:hypothetical protein SESBI_34085 [Sesbania bispinosa]|nr:hypothetical protein SESBI_34085 [Sesbania bispinosa]